MADGGNFDPDSLLTAPPPASASMVIRPSLPQPALSPSMRALLETEIAPGESGGKYNVIYGGKTVDDLSAHPDIAVPITSGPNVGKNSTAAGKYQFIKSTWDEAAKALGLTDFSPASQDRAAAWLAKRTYQQATGRDIESDYASGDPSLREGIRRALSSQWEALGKPGPRQDKLWTLGNDRFRFSDEAMSADDLHYMHPDDYLTLSPSMQEDGGYSGAGWQALRTSLANGETINHVPGLTTENGKVTAQDGRSRALLAKLSGLEMLPVSIKGGVTTPEIEGMGGAKVPAGNLIPGKQMERSQSGDSILGKMFGIGSAQAAETTGAFDPTTARLAEETAPAGGFDPGTAKPVEDIPPHTTAGGVAGSVTRGLAPYAAGAGAGAAMGAPFAGVGAVPGAAAGAGAVGLTQLAGALYNPLAEKFGWPKMATPQEMTDRILDLAGISKPTTGIERMAKSGAEGIGNALSGVGAASQAAQSLTGPVAKQVAERLAERPVTQAVAGMTGGLAEQGAAEAGGGPMARMGAGFLGSLIPSAVHLPRVNASQAAKDAIGAGYSLPPAEATQGKIGAASTANVLAGFSGKVKTRQYASAVNQPVTNRLAATDLGLPPDTALTPQVFRDVIKDAGKSYAALKASPNVAVDHTYLTEVNDIAREARAAALQFPDTIDVSKINKMIADIQAKNVYSPSDMVELSKRLRFDAKANLQARADPDKLALGLAQRQAANSVEDLIERNLTATGQTSLLDAYRDARKLIAKAYDYESVTNVSTNDVDSRHLGGLLDKGKPLTGNAKTIADAANNFPHAFQPAAKIGGVETFSVLDMAYAAAAASTAAAHGDFGLAAILGAAVPFARPAVRASVLSQAFQRAMSSPKPAFTPLPAAMSPGVATTDPFQSKSPLPYIPGP